MCIYICIMHIFFPLFTVPLANAELSRRQIGDLQCNLDRLFIILSVSQTVSNVKELASAGAS